MIEDKIKYNDYWERVQEKDKEIERLNNIIKEQGLEDKPNYYVKGLEESLKEYQEEVKRLNNIINELEEWLKYKKEALEEFDLGKRKETGAFWYTTTGEIEGLLTKLQELIRNIR